MSPLTTETAGLAPKSPDAPKLRRVHTLTPIMGRVGGGELVPIAAHRVVDLPLADANVLVGEGRALAADEAEAA